MQVHNASFRDVNNATDEYTARRRTVSQPGPGSGALRTATAARMNRLKPSKNVMYAPEIEVTQRKPFKEKLPTLTEITPISNAVTIWF